MDRIICPICYEPIEEGQIKTQAIQEGVKGVVTWHAKCVKGPMDISQ